MSKYFPRGALLTQVLGLQCITIKFAPQGAGAPTLLEGEGVASVSRTSAGLFLITLQDTWGAAPVAMKAQCQMAAATDIKAQCGTYTVVSTGDTLAVRTIAVAVETDVAANANNTVSVQLYFKRTTVPS